MTSACTVLCPEINFGTVFEAIHSMSEAEILLDGTPDQWTRATVSVSGKLLTFSILIREHPGDKFSRLVLSLHNCFEPVQSDAPSNKEHVLDRILNVKMMIGVVADPEFLQDDIRLAVLWRVVESMDAVLFNGDAVFNLEGLQLLDRSGNFDVII